MAVQQVVLNRRLCTMRIKKHLAISSALLFSAMFSFAQSNRERIEKAMSDPKAAEHSAKADARVIDKKVIADSTSFKSTESMSKKDRKYFLKRRKSSSSKE